MAWPPNLDVNAAYWQDYQPLIAALPVNGFPDCQSLNQLFPEQVRTAHGHPVRFVSSSELADQDYEQRIFTSGFVSTRPDSWHDLFNALVWMRFPHIKSAINTLHNRVKRESGKRGRLRDALTLFDECGVLLVSYQADFLASAANRDWQRLFQSRATSWDHDARTIICGHAILEKLLSPYKSMTAKALLVQIPRLAMALPHNELLDKLDREISRQMLAGHILTTPAQLSPLPLAGIPGWDFAGTQNEHFYADTRVFRPPPENLRPAPVWSLNI